MIGGWTAADLGAKRGRVAVDTRCRPAESISYSPSLKTLIRRAMILTGASAADCLMPGLSSGETMASCLRLNASPCGSCRSRLGNS
jgi:hypothetical protein